MNLPTISIITPSFNQGKFIERTILSILRQSYKPLEYLIYDGGSIDQTIDILNKWSEYITWESKKDNGQAEAVNKGLKNARGEIIGWINSDDTYNEDTLQRVAEAFKYNPKLEIIYGRAMHIDEDDKIINEYKTAYWDKRLLIHQCFICQPALFFRRRILQHAGVLDETLNYCMDYEYWIRLSRKGYRFGYLNEILANSRLYNENKTLFNRPAVHKEIVEMLKRETGWVSIHWIKAYASTITRKHTKSKNTLIFTYRLITEIAKTQWRYNKNIGFINMFYLFVARMNQLYLQKSVLKASK